MGNKISYRADHIGSLLRPPELLDARARWARAELDAGGLEVVVEDAITDAIQLQEAAGLTIISDGEFRRDNFWIDFLSQVNGVEIGEAAEDQIATSGQKFAHAPKHVRITDRLSRPQAITVKDYQFIKGQTDRAAKITLPTPSRFNIMDGPEWIDHAVYPDTDAMWADVIAIYRQEIADLENAGCRYIQIDEPYLALFVDDVRRQLLEDRHGKPADVLVDEYVEIINQCVQTRGDDTYLALHICRGNSRSTGFASGGYQRISQALSALRVDALLLEYDDERSGGFEPLSAVRAQCTVVLGLISSKFPQLEALADIKQRVREASRYVAMENLALSPQCGFASTHEGNLVSEDDQIAKLKLVVEFANELWG